MFQELVRFLCVTEPALSSSLFSWQRRACVTTPIFRTRQWEGTSEKLINQKLILIKSGVTVEAVCTCKTHVAAAAKDYGEQIIMQNNQKMQPKNMYF